MTLWTGHGLSSVSSETGGRTIDPLLAVTAPLGSKQAWEQKRLGGGGARSEKDRAFGLAVNGGRLRGEPLRTWDFCEGVVPPPLTGVHLGGSPEGPTPW